MSSFRNNEKQDALLTGRRATKQRASVRVGTLQAVNANEVAQVTVLDGDGGDGLTRDMDVCQGIGYMGRPKEPSKVQVVVINVAASSDAPVATGYIDWNRESVLEAAGIGSDVIDVVVIYNSTRAVQILPDGRILIGAPGGQEKALSLKDDSDALNARLDSMQTQINANGVTRATHVHTGGTLLGLTGIPTTTETPVSTAATVTGTAHIRETQ
jgi:hypothetical protein